MKSFKKFLVLLMAVLMLGTVSVSVSAASLSAPKVTVSNTASSGKSKLRWEKVTKAKKYYIYRSTKKTSGYKKIGTTTKTYYTDSDASVGKTYYYKVKAAGGAYSQVLKSKRICAQPDLTVKVNSTTGKPSLSWDKVSGAKEYKVYRSYGADGEYELIKTTTSTSYKDTKVYVDTDCWYRVDVVGKKSGTDSKSEAPVAVHTACAKPEITVKNDKASGDPVISWKAVDGAVSYSVYRSTKSGSGYKKIGTTDEYSYQDESATPGKKYYYKVRAYCESGAKSAYSSYKSVYSDCARPEVEITLNSSQKPKLTWKKISGAKKYEVHRATSKNGTYTKIKTTTSTKYTDSSAKTGKTYYYKVKAIASTSSANSAYSKAKTYVAVKLTVSPTSLNLEVGNNSTLTADYNGTGTLTWKSSNTGVATVSNGKVTAVAAGSAKITVTDGTKSASCDVTVTAPKPVEKTLELKTKSTTISVGDTLQIEYEYSGDDSELTWSVSDDSVLKVNDSGKVTAKAAGKAGVQVTNGSITRRVTITVSAPAVVTTSLEMSSFDAPFSDGVKKFAGDYITFKVWTLPTEGNREIKVTSSDSSVVSVSWEMDSYNKNHVKLKFKTAGSATIKITSGDGAVSKSYTINVKSGYACNPGSGQLDPETWANCCTQVMVENGFTKSTSLGSYRVLTLSADELTFSRAKGLGEDWVHEFYSSGKRYCWISYEGTNEDGNHVFYVRAG